MPNMRLRSEHCVVGEFLVSWKQDGMGEEAYVSNTTFPDYDGAEAYAMRKAREALGRRVFISQVAGELKSTVSVQEVFK